MLKRELLEQLRAIRPVPQDEKKYAALVEEIEDSGVLDVQAPADIAEWMNLSCPASR